MARGFLRRPAWGFIACMLALAALIASLLALAADQREPRFAFDTVASKGGTKVLDRVKVRAGASETLFRSADFKVVGTCVENAADDFTAEVGVRTKKNNAIVFGTDLGNTNDVRLDKADGLFSFTSYEASGTEPLYYGYDYYQEFSAESPSGRVLIGRVSNGVHLKGADCIYSGLFIN